MYGRQRRVRADDEFATTTMAAILAPRVDLNWYRGANSRGGRSKRRRVVKLVFLFGYADAPRVATLSPCWIVAGRKGLVLSTGHLTANEISEERGMWS
jgi:hypothetical protein